MSMMCAVISGPFWAGLLKQITAHTPASAFQNNNLQSIASFLFSAAAAKFLSLYEVNLDLVRNDTFFVTLVE